MRFLLFNERNKPAVVEKQMNELKDFDDEEITKQKKKRWRKFFIPITYIYIYICGSRPHFCFTRTVRRMKSTLITIRTGSLQPPYHQVRALSTFFL